MDELSEIPERLGSRLRRAVLLDAGRVTGVDRTVVALQHCHESGGAVDEALA